jgi:hypothetical protein
MTCLGGLVGKLFLSNMIRKRTLGRGGAAAALGDPMCRLPKAAAWVHAVVVAGGAASGAAVAVSAWDRVINPLGEALWDGMCAIDRPSTF